MTHTYDNRNTLVKTEFACVDGTAGCGTGSDITYADNFRQDQIIDGNNNEMNMVWNDSGSNLESVTDPLENTTTLSYDVYNNLNQAVDALEHETTFNYDNPNFPTFLTSKTDALEQTTYYTPTTAADGAPGLLKQEEDANGRITTYSYNAFGQLTQTVVAAGTADAVTNIYSYDAIGRLTTSTQSSAAESHTNLSVYNDGDQMIASISNWDGVLDWQNCSFAAGPREENICTLYSYDDAGRRVSTKNALGQLSASFYDPAGRLLVTVQNYSGADPLTIIDPVTEICNFSNPTLQSIFVVRRNMMATAVSSAPPML